MLAVKKLFNLICVFESWLAIVFRCGYCLLLNLLFYVIWWSEHPQHLETTQTMNNEQEDHTLRVDFGPFLGSRCLSVTSALLNYQLLVL